MTSLDAGEPDRLERLGDPFEHRRAWPGPRFSRPNATSSSTRSMTIWSDGSWKTSPATAASAPGSNAVVSWPLTVSEPPVTRHLARDQAGNRQAERALAGPRRPDHEQAGARGHLHVHALDRRSSRPEVREPEVAALDPDRTRPAMTGQVGNPSSTPVRRSARTSAIEAAGSRTSPEAAMAIAITIRTSAA